VDLEFRGTLCIIMCLVTAQTVRGHSRVGDSSSLPRQFLYLWWKKKIVTNFLTVFWFPFQLSFYPYFLLAIPDNLSTGIRV
jgi:hypothetical protein